MKYIQKLWSAINGKKTYIVALAWAVYGLLGFALHQIGANQLVTDLLIAAGFAGLRHGVSKAQVVLGGINDLLGAALGLLGTVEKQPTTPTEPATPAQPTK